MNACLLATPIGPLTLEAEGDALTAVRFGDRKPVHSDSPLLREARRQLDAYFSGELTAFSLPVAFHGTAFQNAVWTALRDIPYGTTTTYRALARTIHRPDATRAVGAAVGKNPIAIIVPCHRVLGSDGSLTGFAGGLPTKRTLLALEDLFDPAWDQECNRWREAHGLHFTR